MPCLEKSSLNSKEKLVFTIHKLKDIKGQIISKGLLVSSNSPKSNQRIRFYYYILWIRKFVLLGEFEDAKKSFWNYLYVLGVWFWIWQFCAYVMHTSTMVGGKYWDRFGQKIMNNLLLLTKINGYILTYYFLALKKCYLVSILYYDAQKLRSSEFYCVQCMYKKFLAQRILWDSCWNHPLVIWRHFKRT